MLFDYNQQNPSDNWCFVRLKGFCSEKKKERYKEMRSFAKK